MAKLTEHRLQGLQVLAVVLRRRNPASDGNRKLVCETAMVIHAVSEISAESQTAPPALQAFITACKQDFAQQEQRSRRRGRQQKLSDVARKVSPVIVGPGLPLPVHLSG